MSWDSSGQYSLILVKRYSFLSLDRPGGSMCGGSSAGDGAHCWSLSSLADYYHQIQ